MIAILESLGLDLVPWVESVAPSLASDRDVAVWGGAVVIGTLIWAAGYALLFKHGTEATAPLEDNGSDGQWLALEGAARYFRDESERLGQIDLCKMFDDAADRSPSHTPLADAFRGWALDGVNRNFIKLRARALQGARVVDVEPPLRDDVLAYAIGEARVDVVETVSGLRYSDLEFSREGITKYVEWLSNDEP